VTLRGAVRAWLPPGTWIDLFTSTVYEGDREVELHRGEDLIPALLHAGALLPLAAEDETDAGRNPERLELLVAPGADGDFTLIEDDGTGAAPADIPVARTPISWRQQAGELTIGAAEDPHGVLPATRTWTVTFLGIPAGAEIRVDGEAAAAAAAVGRVSVTVPGVAAGRAIRVRAGADPQPRTIGREEALFAVLNAAHYDHDAKAAAWRTLTSDLPAAAMLAELHAQGLPRELIGALSELLTARA
jgi:hypothetical protein